MLEKAFTGSIDAILQLGLSGVVILALGFVVWRLHKLYVETQEKRIAEGREAITAIERSSNALDNLSEIIRAKREL